MKKIIYIALTTFLGLILSFLVHAIAEMSYIKYALAKGIILVDHTFFIGGAYCVLPVWLQVGIFILGVGGGFYLGFRWWDYIYVQKKHLPWYKRLFN
jgi:hypothetical protein